MTTEKTMTTEKVLDGKPHAGNSHMRFDAGVLVFCVLLSSMSVAASIGYKEAGGVHVPAGTSDTLSGNIIEGAEGKLYKTGDGTLTVPLSQVNRQTDWNLTALGGTMQLTLGDDATVDVANPPAILQKAKLWLDQSSVITTNGASPWYEGTTALCKKWVDVRDRNNPDVPRHVYAMPNWTERTASNDSDYMGVPPAQVTENGRTALFFYGAKGVHLVLSESITNTIQFVVHGIRSSNGVWGPVIGSSNRRGGGYLTSISSSASAIDYSNVTAHFVTSRMDCTYDYAHSRNFLDGELFDPFTVKPKNTFQLFETHFRGRRQMFDSIFYNNFDGFSSATTPQGGDYVCEIIVFEDAVSETERLEVERYLMKKWSLPDVAASTIRYPEKTGLLGAAANATVRIDTASGQSTPPVAFMGEGTLLKRESGTLDMGLGGQEEMAGQLQIDEGDVVVRSGRIPAQKAMAGYCYTGAAYNPGTRQKDDTAAPVDAAAGVRLTRTGLVGGTGKVEKNGNDWVRFNEIESTVKHVKVTAGTLQLESKPFVTNYVAASAKIEATIPNADFEMSFVTNMTYGRTRISDCPENGWRKVAGFDAANYLAWTNSNSHVYFGDVGTTRVRPYGNQVLLLNQTAGADTTITIPASGVYTFECVAKSRFDTSHNSTRFNFVKLSVGSDSGSLVEFGELHATAQQFNRYRFRMPYLEAGTYVLRLAGTMNGGTGSETNDGATLVDSVRAVRENEPDGAVAFKVPNGDFESIDKAAARPYYTGGSSLDNVPTGWTLAVTNTTFASYTENTLIGAISGFFQHSYEVPLYDEFAERVGNKALSFRHVGAYARTSFTAPAGLFYLRGLVAFHPMNYTPKGASGEYAAGNIGSLAAKLTLANGTVIALGSVSASSTLATGKTWPNTFEIPESQTVTLELYQTAANGSAILDDLVFVKDIRAGVNLIDSPNAEFTSVGATRWTFASDKSFWSKSAPSVESYNTSNAKYYGFCAFEGAKTFAFQCVGIMYQTITVPEAGIYRFTCHSRTRADDSAYSGNGVRFWMTRPGSGVTNFNNTLLIPYKRNFTESSWLVNVPESGSWIFGMTGTGVAGQSASADRLSYIDDISLVRAAERADVPSVPRKFDVEVAAGARLVLDYPGTVKVRHLTLGGVRKEGIVSATTDPDYIGGVGKLEIVPSGITIDFK